MCTIALYFQVFEDYPLIVGANRDERYARRSQPPQLLCETPRIVGGRDEQAGGTWMGIGAGGLWLGIANRSTQRAAYPARRSRGRLCLDLLAAGSGEDAQSLARRIEPGRYNPFYLLAADPQTAFLLSVDEETTLQPLTPGLYVLTNAGLNQPDDPRRRRAWPKLSRMGKKGAPPSLKEWKDLLADHGATGDEALCLHEAMRGTRSSTVLQRHELLERSRYYYADGPPCRLEFAEYTGLLTQNLGVS